MIRVHEISLPVGGGGKTAASNFRSHPNRWLGTVVLFLQRMSEIQR
jgi:hypothetical protein